MDILDKKLLDIIQTGFPIASRPYAVLGEMLELTEAETLARVRALQEAGIIRRIGANFQTAKLGWHSTLCAAKVPSEKLKAFTAEVNSHAGVTHNYLRKHDHNVWFTYIGQSEEAVQAALKEITRKTGIAILNLPALQVFKIKVDFSMQDENGE